MTKNSYIATLPIIGILALLSLAINHCGQDINSNSGDEAYGGGNVSLGACELPGDKRRCDAITVLQTRCFACHSEWASYTTDQEWVSSGLVVNGKPDSSELITKIINAGGDMPDNGSALPDAEYTTLRSWVELIDLTAPTTEDQQ